MILKLMQKYGHRPIVLLGGGTTLIGDPSGKDAHKKNFRYKEKLRIILKASKRYLTKF